MDNIMEVYELIENNQSEKAIKMLKQLEAKADDDEKFTIAQMYNQLGFLQEASGILYDLLNKYPDESEIKITLADVYIELEEDEQAIDLLVQIKEEDSSYIQALIQLADLYQAQGLFEVAEQKLLTAKQLEPNEEIIDFALGELFFSIGEYKKAILYYEKMVPGTEYIANISLHDRLGEAYAASGEYEKALTYYKDKNDKDPDTLFRYGITAYQADRIDISIKAWEKVIDIDPYYHTVYVHLAKAYEDEGRPEEAFKTAKKGLQFDEFNKELYFLAGTLAHKLDNNEESQAFIKEAVALEPDYKEAVLFLVELYKNGDEQEKIIDLLTEIKRSGADDSLYDWELARAYNEIELYDNALKHYNEAYNNLNQDSDFVKEFGYFLTEEGRMGEAIPVFESYLKLVPLDGEVEEFVNRLKLSKQDF
ncbi:tetratricopeptide repeat protein [Oceanobacillus salinisoli]|uniref:tetratricopeptide repeat protein n=1 Tax=Oceanobacillus salinisoli TaxID=2678611 RepID=UPI0012E11E9D|nr:tetratricopeptide repeat protein [Oceanobacillus salinisoli]